MKGTKMSENPTYVSNNSHQIKMTFCIELFKDTFALRVSSQSTCNATKRKVLTIHNMRIVQSYPLLIHNLIFRERSFGHSIYILFIFGTGSRYRKKTGFVSDTSIFPDQKRNWIRLFRLTRYSTPSEYPDPDKPDPTFLKTRTRIRPQYCVSKKQLPLLYSKLLYKMGDYFLDTRYRCSNHSIIQMHK